MAVKKRALLIGCPTYSLRGPINDVDKIAKVLGRLGFEITRCCGLTATRAKILQEWQNLIDASMNNDAVVIYYSGHGGLVESPQQKPNEPWRYQFILPADYNETTDQDFRGILEVELTYMLQKTTDKTENVTVVFDCCHAGQMVRLPRHMNTVAKRIPEIQHYNISNHISSLAGTGMLQGDRHFEENKKAVRLAAAAAVETAWEYEDMCGVWRGAMTEALCHAIEEAGHHKVSWRTIILRVQEMVNRMFPYQHPHVEGPAIRVLFSTQEIDSRRLDLKVIDGEAIIQAGRVAGVRNGSVYAVMPFGYETIDQRSLIAKATVNHVKGFLAGVELAFEPSMHDIPNGQASVFLLMEAISRWPIEVPHYILGLREAINSTQFLKSYDASEDLAPLAVTELQADRVVLRTSSGAQIASERIANGATDQALGNIVRVAEQLGRAQHLLALGCERQQDELEHKVKTAVGLVDNGKPGEEFRQDGKDTVMDNDRIYISIKNNGTKTVYVSVLNINVKGEVVLISNATATGIDLPPDREYRMGVSPVTGALRGLGLSWPNGVPRWQPVEEHLLFMLTDSPMSFRNIATRQYASNKSMACLSNLERLCLYISQGAKTVGAELSVDRVRYSIFRVSFSLYSSSLKQGPNPCIPSSLPDPNVVPDSESLPSYPAFLSPVPKVCPARSPSLETLCN